MVIKTPKKRQRQLIKDKLFDPMNLKDGGFGEDDDEPEDEDEDDTSIEETEDDEVFDKDLLRTIRKHHPRNKFLGWLISRGRQSSDSNDKDNTYSTTTIYAASMERSEDNLLCLLFEGSRQIVNGCRILALETFW